MWLIIALVSYIAAAVVSILDKFILSNEKVSPLRFVFYSTIFVTPLFFLAPWTQLPVSWLDWLAAILVGFGFAGGLWTMYLGIAKSEISHIGPLIGGIIPLFVLLFSRVFLRETISGRQLLAIFLLVLGSLLISSEYTGKKQEWHGAIAWGLVAAILFAVSHVAAKYLYNQIGFVGGFVWGRGFTGLFGVLLLLVPGFWRELFSSRMKWFRIKTSVSKLTLVAIDKILAVAALVLVQYAIFLGSVTVVNALAGVQYAFLLILVGVMSRFSPNRFHEEYSKTEIIQEIVSVVIIAIGLAFLL
jgi:drug/metabolite transporter (DMT)-like permease